MESYGALVTISCNQKQTIITHLHISFFYRYPYVQLLACVMCSLQPFARRFAARRSLRSRSSLRWAGATVGAVTKNQCRTLLTF